MEVVRQPNDGYDIEIILGNASLIRGFSPEDVLADPAQFIDAAVTLGIHAAAYEFAISRNKREREELVGRLRPLTEFDGWDIVTSGRVSVDDFVADAERLFNISPGRNVWGYVVVSAKKAARHSWATSSTKLSDQPWAKIADRLTVFGEERGWGLTDEDWE